MSPQFKRVEELHAVKYCNLTVREIYQHSLKIKTNSYAAPFGTVNEYYYDLETSIRLLNDLLMFQCDNDKLKVSKWWKLIS